MNSHNEQPQEFSLTFWVQENPTIKASIYNQIAKEIDLDRSFYIQDDDYNHDKTWSLMCKLSEMFMVSCQVIGYLIFCYFYDKFGSKEMDWFI